MRAKIDINIDQAEQLYEDLVLGGEATVCLTIEEKELEFSLEELYLHELEQYQSIGRAVLACSLGQYIFEFNEPLGDDDCFQCTQMFQKLTLEPAYLALIPKHVTYREWEILHRFKYDKSVSGQCHGPFPSALKDTLKRHT